MFVYFYAHNIYVHNQVTSFLGRARDNTISILSHTVLRFACGHSFVVTRVSFTSLVCRAGPSTFYLAPASLTRRMSVFAVNAQVVPLPLEALIVLRH